MRKICPIVGCTRVGYPGVSMCIPYKPYKPGLWVYSLDILSVLYSYHIISSQPRYLVILLSMADIVVSVLRCMLSWFRSFVCNPPFGTTPVLLATSKARQGKARHRLQRRKAKRICKITTATTTNTKTIKNTNNNTTITPTATNTNMTTNTYEGYARTLPGKSASSYHNTRY